jgi:hypothetical protein
LISHDHRDFVTRKPSTHLPHHVGRSIDRRCFHAPEETFSVCGS